MLKFGGRDWHCATVVLSRRRSIPLPKCSVAVLFSGDIDRTLRFSFSPLAVSLFQLAHRASCAPHQLMSWLSFLRNRRGHFCLMRPSFLRGPCTHYLKTWWQASRYGVNYTGLILVSSFSSPCRTSIARYRGIVNSGIIRNIKDLEIAQNPNRIKHLRMPSGSPYKPFYGVMGLPLG